MGSNYRRARVVATRQDDKVIIVAVKMEDDGTHDILRFDLNKPKELCSWINFRAAIGSPVELPASFLSSIG
jgi:hypothetical protein